MAVVDSYEESNKNTSDFLYTGGTTYTAVGQSFTGNGGKLDKTTFYLRKEGTPPSNVVSKIYAHSGTFGSSSVPTGAALATSDNVVATSLSTSFSLADFNYSGANEITLTSSTKYVVTVEYSPVGSNNLNYVEVGRDSSSPTHGGNWSGNFGGWSALSGSDLIFYVYDTSVAGGSTPLRSLMGIGV